ncbi:MAG: EVE domain-containing protein [Armatimonadetes bacterium]|nr:EVE domain-containing protein [Armatimonadota bacterium]
MRCFLVIGSDIQPFEGSSIPAPEVYDLMMKHQCWEFTGSAPHLDKMKKGDRILFYLGGNQARYFAGEAEVAGEFESVGPKSGGAFDRKQIPFFAWRVPLREIRRYPPRRAGLDEMMDLSFVREKNVDRPYVGLLLRVGVREIAAGDLDRIRSAVSAGV